MTDTIRDRRKKDRRAANRPDNLPPELVPIYDRLDAGDERMARIEGMINDNTTLTQQLVTNTAGLVTISGDLEKGALFLCRLAKFVRFLLKDVIDPLWRPLLVIFIAWYLLADHNLPPWLLQLIKGVWG